MHVETSLGMEISQLANLPHHQLFHHKLIDDFLLHIALHTQVAHIEVHTQLLLSSQLRHLPGTARREPSVIRLHTHATERQFVLRTTHPRLEIKRQTEMLQRRRESSRNILEISTAGNITGRKTQTPTRLSIGQLHLRVSYFYDR